MRPRVGPVVGEEEAAADGAAVPEERVEAARHVGAGAGRGGPAGGRNREEQREVEPIVGAGVRLGPDRVRQRRSAKNEQGSLLVHTYIMISLYCGI